MELNKGNFHNTESDSYTASTLRRMKAGDGGPNSSPSVNMQMGSPGGMGGGRGEGNTPNSAPSDTNSGANYGQELVHVDGMTMAVEAMSGIPASDPNAGGASELQKGNAEYGFTMRRSGGSA